MCGSDTGELTTRFNGKKSFAVMAPKAVEAKGWGEQFRI